MLKRLLSVALALVVVGQEISSAAEPVPPLAAVATEGSTLSDVAAGDPRDVIVGHPLIQGGTDRISIPRGRSHAARSQQSAPRQTRVTAKGLLVTAVVLGIASLVLKWLFAGV